MYIATICGYFITLSILHRCWFYIKSGVEPGITLCKSGHLVSAALSVKNRVGKPSWVIISVISLRHMFQYSSVPQRRELNRIKNSNNLVSQKSLSSLHKSSTVVGIPSSMFFCTNTIIVSWLRCLIIMFNI